MYGRHYGGKDLRFEASGGLMHGALVMQDKETGSYWPIMTGESISGELEGTRLDELPVGEKAQWKDWVAAHPETRVLSVNGRQHVENNPYDQYLASDSGFRGIAARDDRLGTKDPIYAFHQEGVPFAVPFEALQDGGVFRAGGRELFLYRRRGVAIYYSTLAFEGSPGTFQRRDGLWEHEPSGALLEPEQKSFVAADGSLVPVSRIEGFDTFWYMWSLTNPGTRILSRTGASR